MRTKFNEFVSMYASNYLKKNPLNTLFDRAPIIAKNKYQIY